MAGRWLSPEERSLRQAIVESPDDDVPRLIYADWLDEHGRSLEAEFVRVQVASAQLESLPRAEQERHVTLYRRQDELLAQLEGLLLGDLPEPLRKQSRCEFHRGLLCALTAPLESLLLCLPRLRHLLPLPRLCLEDTTEHVCLAIGCRRQTKPTAEPQKQATDEGLAPAALHELVGVLHSVQTKEDDFWRPWGQRRAARPWQECDEQKWSLSTEAVPHFPLLQKLDLAGVHLGDENMQSLFRAAHRFPQLRYLDVSANDLGDSSVAALLQTPWPRQLQQLVLGGNPLTDQAAQLLVERWPVDSPLENLNLRFTVIGHEGRRLLIHRFGGRVWLF